MTWLIIMCARCGYPRMVRASQKTYRCFKCSYRGRVAEAKIVAEADSPRKLPYAVGALKMKVARGEIRVVYDASRVKGRRRFRGWFKGGRLE